MVIKYAIDLDPVEFKFIYNSGIGPADNLKNFLAAVQTGKTELFTDDEFPDALFLDN